MKIDRLFSILQILINKKNVTAKELASRFDVSVRTIYRDIDVLSANGVPVYCSQGKGGGISILDNYMIDKAILTDEEQKQVLLSLQSVNVTGQINVEDSLIKLRNVFNKNNTDWIEIDFSNWEQSHKEKEKFTAIKESIIDSKIIKFSYYSTKGEILKRIVEPYRLVFKGYQWYVYGFCKVRNDFRFFKLTRIDELSVTGEIFERRQNIDINTEYSTKESEYIKVKMKISSRMAARVYDEFRKGIIEFDGNNFIVEADIQKNEYLYTYFLGYGNDIEVLEPIEVRNKLKNLLKDILKKY